MIAMNLRPFELILSSRLARTLEQGSVLKKKKSKKEREKDRKTLFGMWIFFQLPQYWYFQELCFSDPVFILRLLTELSFPIFQVFFSFSKYGCFSLFFFGSSNFEELRSLGHYFEEYLSLCIPLFLFFCFHGYVLHIRQ